MMHGLFAFLLVHVLAWLGQKAHGSQIINGKDVPGKSMLYMVSVQSDQKGHLCGGFLVSEEFVITAAHCANNKPTHVVFGTHNLKKADNSTMRRIAKRCLHPSYKDVITGNDIMLLKLDQKVKGKTAKVIQVSSKKIKDNQRCSVAGWGLTKSGGKSVDVLQAVDVNIINKEVCEKAWGRVYKNKLPDSIICAGGYDTKNGFCQGDSGGPLVCNNVAVGVVSFNKKSCDYPNVPNIYTDISKYSPWIKKILKTKQC